MEESNVISSGAVDDIHSATATQDAPGEVINPSGGFDLPPLTECGVCQRSQCYAPNRNRVKSLKKMEN